jgi:hypothetical protein
MMSELGRRLQAAWADFGHKADFTSRNLRCRTARVRSATIIIQRGQMASRFGFWSGAVAFAGAIGAIGASPASAQNGIPFGFEMTLDAPPQPGSKRVPSLEIGDSGEVKLELWCKSGKGQFSVAGNTVIFAAGPLEDRSCPPEKAQADDELVAALSAAATWKRQGDEVSFAGPTTLRFHLNTN